MDEPTFCSTVDDLLLAICREPLAFGAKRVYWDSGGQLAIGKCELFKTCFWGIRRTIGTGGRKTVLDACFAVNESKAFSVG